MSNNLVHSSLSVFCVRVHAFKKLALLKIAKLDSFFETVSVLPQSAIMYSLHWVTCLSPNSITPTLRRPGQVRDKVKSHEGSICHFKGLGKEQL